MIGLGGQLHDIGKVAIPETILQKPGKLTEDEWKIMQTHPVIGEQVVSTIAGLRDLAPIIRGHHERWDGRGYPDQLAEEAIPLGARIVSVVDAFEAITTDRPYQVARPLEWALAELQNCAGTQFDRQVVHALKDACASSQSVRKHVA